MDAIPDLIMEDLGCTELAFGNDTVEIPCLRSKVNLWMNSWLMCWGQEVVVKVVRGYIRLLGFPRVNFRASSVQCFYK